MLKSPTAFIEDDTGDSRSLQKSQESQRNRATLTTSRSDFVIFSMEPRVRNRAGRQSHCIGDPDTFSGYLARKGIYPLRRHTTESQSPRAHKPSPSPRVTCVPRGSNSLGQRWWGRSPMCEREHRRRYGRRSQLRHVESVYQDALGRV